jgi:hypothetical protein
MKTKTFVNFLIFAALLFSACTPVFRVPSKAEVAPNADMKPPEVISNLESGQAVNGKCSRSSDQVRLLINSVHQYCLQYPAEYDVFFPNESEMMLIKGSVLNVSEPSVSVMYQLAGEVTLEQAADQIAQDYAIPGMEPIREPLNIDGEAAIMLDGLSGQDPNRQVVVLHNNYLYRLYFIQMNKNQPEAYAQSETLYRTVIQSFNFRPDSNLCSGCPVSEEDPQTAMISGWVWHDLCNSGMDGQPAPATTPPGCVKEDSPLGLYHADGLLTSDEPLIEGVVVTLGEGACPATGLAETSTINTDLSYAFTGLKAGRYCVSIDPQREPNFSILRPGEWTYPVVTQDVISVAVTLAPGEYKGMLNFGWDYQFKP